MGKKIAGVYKIVCSANNKVYVGSSINVYERWRKHKEVVNRDKGFNLKPTSSSMLGFKQDKETVLKRSKQWIITTPQGKEIEITNLSDFCRGNGLSCANMHAVSKGGVSHHKNYKCRPAVMSKEEWERLLVMNAPQKWHFVSPTGEEYFVRSPDFVSFCGEHGLSVHSMRDLARGRKKSIRGWTAEFIGHRKKGPTGRPSNTTPEVIDKIRDKLSKEFIVRKPDGTELKIKNLRKFCLENGLLGSEMITVASGKVDQHRGWHCRRHDVSMEEWIVIREAKRKPRDPGDFWKITNPDGEIITIKNLNEFCRQNNLCAHSMRDLDKGRLKSYKGWKCEKIKNPHSI